MEYVDVDFDPATSRYQANRPRSACRGARHVGSEIPLVTKRTEPSHKSRFRPPVWALLADIELLDGGNAHPWEFGRPTCWYIV